MSEAKQNAMVADAVREAAASEFDRLGGDVFEGLSPAATKRLQTLFKEYSRLGADAGKLSAMGARSESMDFYEYVACMTHVGILGLEPFNKTPAYPLTGRAALHADRAMLGEVFRSVNRFANAKDAAEAANKGIKQRSGAAADTHELSLDEFVVAIRTLSTHLRRPLDSLLIGHHEHLKLGDGKIVQTPKSGQTQTPKGGPEDKKLVPAKQGSKKEVSIKGLEEIKKEHMEALHSIFEEKGGELDIDDFRETFGALMNLSDDECATMFMRIDADNDQTVSWDEFSTYALALGQVTRSWDADTVLGDEVNLHSDREFDHAATISVACKVNLNQWRYDPQSDKYLTATTDGTIRLWYAASGHPFKSDVVIKGPGGWVMGACAMTKFNIAVIASNDQKMRFYSLEPRFVLQMEYQTINCHPLCVHSFAIRSKTDGETRSFLAWGDDRGRVFVIREEDIMDEKTMPGQGLVAQISHKRVMKAHNKRNFKFEVGLAWVSKIEFVPDLHMNGLLVVASSDSQVLTFDIENQVQVSVFKGHSMAVKAFAWCKQYKSMASGGLDREIQVWDWKTGRRSGTLSGHKSPIDDMCYYEKRDVLFSLDTRHHLLMWDASKQVLLDRLNTDEQDVVGALHRFRVGRILVDQDRGHLAMCARHPHLWKIKIIEEQHQGVVRHYNPIVTALYNQQFHQVVSIDRIGLVSVWEISTGRQTFKFYISSIAEDGAQEEPSSACFDQLGRRLIIGWSLGTVQSYNFNNGRMTCLYESDATMGIIKVQCSGEDGKADSKLFACGLESCVWMWPAAPPDDAQTATLKATITPVVKCERRIQLPIWRVDWRVEFLSMDWHWSALVATGRRDGHVLLWNVNTGFLRKDLIGGIFSKIDEDGSGSLSPDEVISYLVNKENYTEKEASAFAKRADADGSGEIDKKEFMRELEISRQTATTGDAEGPKTGHALEGEEKHRAVYLRTDQNVEWVHFMKNYDRLLITVSQDGQVIFYDRVTGADVGSVQLKLEDRQTTVTCCCLDSKEGFLIAGDSKGIISVYEMSFGNDHINKGKKTPADRGRPGPPCGQIVWEEEGGGAGPPRSSVVSIFEAHDSVTSVQWVDRSSLILSSGDAQREKVCVWTLDGERLGTFGDAEYWMVPGKPDDGLVMRLKQAAEARYKALANQAGGGGLVIGEDGFVMPDQDIPEVMKRLRTRKTEGGEPATLKSVFKLAGHTIVNANFYGMAAIREKEVQGRLNRVKRFFDRRIGAMIFDELREQMLTYLETVWRVEVSTLTKAELKPVSNFVFRTRVGTAEKALLSPEDLLRSLVDDFLDESELVWAKKGITNGAQLPPQEHLVKSLVSYVEQALKRYPSLKVDLACLRAFLIVGIVHKRLEKGRVSVADSTASSEADSLELKHHKFKIQYGSHPSWDEGVSREERKRSRLVGTAVGFFTGNDKERSQVDHWSEDPHLRSQAAGSALQLPKAFPEIQPFNLPCRPIQEKEASDKKRRGDGRKKKPSDGIGPITKRRQEFRNGRGLTMVGGRAGMGLTDAAMPRKEQGGTWSTLFLYDMSDTQKAMKLYSIANGMPLKEGNQMGAKSTEKRKSQSQVHPRAMFLSATPPPQPPEASKTDTPRPGGKGGRGKTPMTMRLQGALESNDHQAAAASPIGTAQENSRQHTPANSIKPSLSSARLDSMKPPSALASLKPPALDTLSSPRPALVPEASSKPPTSPPKPGASGSEHGSRNHRSSTDMGRSDSKITPTVATSSKVELGVKPSPIDTGSSSARTLPDTAVSKVTVTSGKHLDQLPSSSSRVHSPPSGKHLDQLPSSSSRVHSPPSGKHLDQLPSSSSRVLSPPKSARESRSPRRTHSNESQADSKGMQSPGRSLRPESQGRGVSSPGRGVAAERPQSQSKSSRGGARTLKLADSSNSVANRLSQRQGSMKGSMMPWNKPPVEEVQGRMWVCKVDDVLPAPPLAAADIEARGVPGDSSLRGKLFEASGYVSPLPWEGREGWEEQEEEEEEEWVYEDELLDGEVGYSAVALASENMGRQIERMESGAKSPGAGGQGSPSMASMPAISWKLRTFWILDDVLYTEEEGGVESAEEGRGRMVCEITYQTQVRPLDGVAELSAHPFAFEISFGDRIGCVCVASADYRDSLVWQRAIERGVERAKEQRRIQSMHAITESDKERTRIKALDKIHVAEDLLKRHRKHHLKDVGKQIRLINMLGKIPHFDSHHEDDDDDEW